MIKRKLFKSLREHLSKKEITLIAGPRQAGKSTLMLKLSRELEQQGEKTLFLNLDIESDKQFFTSQELLIRKVRLEFGESGGFVFLDEIQRKENAGLFLKGLYDMNLPYKFIVSGSGNLELKEKIHESLAGRKRIFMLSTLSFEEFVNFKTDYKYEDRLADFFDLEAEKSRLLLEEYLIFGGYPKVVLESEFREKRAVINEIYQSYLEKDIAYLLKVEKTFEFGNLFKCMASQIGKLTNIAELSRTLQLSASTVKNYLWYLEKTFILQKVSPYFENTRKELTKAPMFYFFDLGMRNHALGLIGENIHEKGFLFQNFVHNILYERLVESGQKINFWRTKAGAEMDFVIKKGNEIQGIEVKYSDLRKPEISRSTRSFIEKFKPLKVNIVNLSLKAEIEEMVTKVSFEPYSGISL